MQKSTTSLWQSACQRGCQGLPTHLEDLDGVGNQGVIEGGAEDEEQEPEAG
jgi:hypothetical protein